MRMVYGVDVDVRALDPGGTLRVCVPRAAQS
jgi:hypothetical protein